VAGFAALSVALWAVPLDPVTNVAVDAWAAWRLARLLWPEPVAPALDGAVPAESPSVASAAL